MNFRYLGVPLDRDVEATFVMAMTEEGARVLASALPSRRVDINLQLGQRWPSTMKRGWPVICNIAGHKFKGSILYRRMHHLALEGTFAEEEQA